MKSSTPQPRRKTRRARRRQNMIGACNIVADRLRRMRAKKDRARIANAGRQCVGTLARDLEVLGRNGIHERYGVGKFAHQNDGTKVAPGRSGNRAARQ